MIWEKGIYDLLINCATRCDEFATECSRWGDVENWYKSIFLGLDCADICRQLAMLYVRGSENTPLLAKACIEVCEKCVEEVNKFDVSPCQQISALCQQTILSCTGILEMASHTEKQNIPVTNSAPLFYGINLREMLYN